MVSNVRAMPVILTATLATSACGGNGSVPTSAGIGPQATEFRAALGPDDNTSILKTLTKNVVIGSTVDPANGDKGPRALSIVPTTYGLKKGQLLVCNFEDSSGTAGNGTPLKFSIPPRDPAQRGLRRAARFKAAMATRSHREIRCTRPASTAAA
jgi:hypothetical protein